MSSLVTLAYAAGNVLSSVTLVLLNKRVFARGFFYPMSLSCFHFGFTIAFFQAPRAPPPRPRVYPRPVRRPREQPADRRSAASPQVLWLAGLYQKPKEQLPQAEKFKVAASGFSSIGFMNLSLTYNSVGFYQVTKLVMIPVTLAINAIFYGVTTSTKIKLSLLLILGGVGVATVTDVELRPLGFGFGCCAVMATAMFQIWQGTKQKEFGLSGTQLQAAIAPWQTAQALLVAGLAEGMCWQQTPCDNVVDFFESYADPKHQRTLLMVLGTCFIALLVNFTSFGLIGRTGPITFQVVGHAKTCLVLIGGYVLFPAKNADPQQMYNNIAGVSVAFLGCILYGNIKYADSNKAPDCLDMTCPSMVLHSLAPKVLPEESEETEETAMVRK